MKRIRSLIIFVICIILIPLLFTACIQIMPQPTSDTTEETAESVEEDKPTEDEPEPTDKPDSTDPPQESKSPSSQPGATELFLGEPIMVDLYGDGTATQIKIIDEDGALVLMSAQGSVENALQIANIPAGYLTNAYYVKSFDGYPFVIVSYDYISDDYETKVFTFTGFEPYEEFKLPLYVTQINEFGFDAYGYIQAVGTWAAGTSVYFVQDMIEWRGTYVLDKDGDAYTKAITAMNLPVLLIQNDEDVYTNLAPGTALSFIETDGESYVWFVLDDGTDGEFYFEWDSDWIEMIDGVNAYEYFEELPLFG
ncbi:MAG: hypothetical protein HN948_07385 [Clostridia bacterium]|jgi:hypothetical protein|nr:hypothetical protein [Clostridia bacterium]MBT7122816.1 hypothetical protein [Clostridia bacterium]